MMARAFPLAAAFLLTITSRVAAQQPDYERESLAGLDGLRVIVGDLIEPAQEGGLTEDALQTYLEMRLRQAQIPVLPLDEWSERQAFVYLKVVALPIFTTGTREWAYKIDLGVKQVACISGGLEGKTSLLARRGGCALFTTWDTGGLVIATGSLPDEVRGSLAGFVDELVNDYLAVNP